MGDKKNGHFDLNDPKDLERLEKFKDSLPDGAYISSIKYNYSKDSGVEVTELDLGDLPPILDEKRVRGYSLEKKEFLAKLQSTYLEKPDELEIRKKFFDSASSGDPVWDLMQKFACSVYERVGDINFLSENIVGELETINGKVTFTVAPASGNFPATVSYSSPCGNYVALLEENMAVGRPKRASKSINAIIGDLLKG